MTTPSTQAVDLDSDSVNSSEIVAGAVDSSEIGDGQVGTVDLASGAATSAVVGNNAVGSGDLATISVVVDATPYDFGDQNEGNNLYEYGTSIVDCPGGSTVIGSGGDFVGAGNGGTGGNALQAITELRLASNGVIATAASDVDNQDFAAIAYCLSTGA